MEITIGICLPVHPNTPITGLNLICLTYSEGYDASSFSYAAVVLWNNLCDDGLTGSDFVAEFTARLKTQLSNI